MELHAVISHIGQRTTVCTSIPRFLKSYLTEGVQTIYILARDVKGYPKIKLVLEIGRYDFMTSFR